MNHRLALLRRFGRSRSLAVAPRLARVASRDRLRGPAPAPATWLASRTLAADIGDTAALEKRRVPGFDYLCGGGVMWVETGAMFCVWDDSSNA